MHLSSYYHGSVKGCNLMVNHNVKALCTINSSPLCFPWWLHVMSVAVASVLEFEAGCLFRWGFLAGSAVKKKKKKSVCSTGDAGLIRESGRSPGGRNGNPLQYSCLENPMDRGAWWATVHRVSQGKTWLSMHASHLVCSDDQINTIPISLSKDVQKSFLEILWAPYHVLTHKNFEFVEFSSWVEQMGC